MISLQSLMSKENLGMIKGIGSVSDTFPINDLIIDPTGLEVSK